MHTETALTILIGRARLAPFTATGYGSASQRQRGIIGGHMVEAHIRGEQVRVTIDGSSKLVNQDDAFDVLEGNIDYDSLPAEYFHGA